MSEPAGIERPLFLAGAGELLRAVTDPPEQDGPPYVHTFRPPEPEYDEDGEPLPMPVGPSLSFVSWPPREWRERARFGTYVSPTPFLSLDGPLPGPVFTGCLAFLAEEAR